MGKDTADIGVHVQGHPPVLLCDISVVCKILADLILLQAQSADLGHEVHDPPHDQVLTTITAELDGPTCGP
jgi:hypothetical protein